MWADGTLKIDVVLSEGWLNSTFTFTSSDLKRTYGFSTILKQERFYVETQEAFTSTVTVNAKLFVITEDETPLETGSSATVEDDSVISKGNSTKTPRGTNTAFSSENLSPPGATALAANTDPSTGLVYP